MSQFRYELRAEDEADIAGLVARTGVFNEEEVAIARELIRDTRAGSPGADYLFLIADGMTGIEGYTCYGRIPGTDNRYELYWIAVDPDSHRHGLGRALLEASEHDVRKRGGTHLFAETSTRDDYAPARRFYGANGYSCYAEVPDFHADGDGLAIFGKRL
jgi:GNAT superfamily N-acetyltransferase